MKLANEQRTNIAFASYNLIYSQEWYFFFYNETQKSHKQQTVIIFQFIERYLFEVLISFIDKFSYDNNSKL